VNLQELNELDLSNIGDWPLPIKLVLVLILCALVVVGGYFGVITDQEDRLARVQREEADLRQEFESKQAKAANLENYKKQLALMEESFGAMRRQLPDSTEVADLLVDVSQTGLAAGLEFELFQPQGEARKEFYAELPIKLRVQGNYHEFGEFVSGLAALPRIVTIHDVRIRPKSARRGESSELLMLEATARTYRYLDEEGR
jgi:type IV pilus assembly protein PilO